MERLRRAGKELLQWRDLRAPWRREPFDRDAEVTRCVDELCAFADLTAHPSWNDDPLFKSTADVPCPGRGLRGGRAPTMTAEQPSALESGSGHGGSGTA